MTTRHPHTNPFGGSRQRIVAGLAVVLSVVLAVLCGVATPADRVSREHGDEDGRDCAIGVLLPAVEATFREQSYAPGTTATLELWKAAPGVTVRLFRADDGGGFKRTNIAMQGRPMGPATTLGDVKAHQRFPLRIGAWHTGLYFAELKSADGLVGYAPFIVRPTRLGEHRVAVVLPTYTWQAYNHRDDDGNGWADTWYATGSTAPLVRPFLNRGVPPHYRSYDLTFLRWLAWTHKQVDVLADADLDRVAGARDLARAYDLVIFPGHHEYVTEHEYGIVTGYRDLGGHLMFLSANNFFWKIEIRDGVMHRVRQWRHLNQPEAALIGVQYIANDNGSHRGPWVVTWSGYNHWTVGGAGFAPGAQVATGGIEIDHTNSFSPRGTVVLAELKDVLGPGFTGQMSYYETAAGAKVFAAGAFTLAGAAATPTVSRLLENLWSRLAEPNEHPAVPVL